MWVHSREVRGHSQSGVRSGLSGYNQLYLTQLQGVSSVFATVREDFDKYCETLEIPQESSPAFIGRISRLSVYMIKP